MPDALGALVVVFNLAVAAVLIWKYRQTRDIGFIWLGLAIVIWPLLSRILFRLIIDGALNKQLRGNYPFSLMARGEVTVGGFASILGSVEQFVGAVLMLIAVFYLARTRRGSNPPAAA